MSDRLPGTSHDNPIWYRGYRIHIGPAYTRDSRWEYSHEDWDGAPTYPGDGPADRRYGTAETADACKAEIDDIEDDLAVATRVRASEKQQQTSDTGLQRFFIDHGMIHDRMTGKHVDTEPVEYEEGKFDLTPINEACELLNELAALAAGSGTAKTAKPVECEASQSGPNASEGNAQTPPPYSRR